MNSANNLLPLNRRPLSNPRPQPRRPLALRVSGGADQK